jgi:hypothetical protein
MGYSSVGRGIRTSAAAKEEPAGGSLGTMETLAIREVLECQSTSELVDRAQLVLCGLA